MPRKLRKTLKFVENLIHILNFSVSCPTTNVNMVICSNVPLAINLTVKRVNAPKTNRQLRTFKEMVEILNAGSIILVIFHKFLPMLLNQAKIHQFYCLP